MRRKVFLIFMIVWMAVIFFFSSRDAEESTEDSYWVGIEVGRLVVPAFSEMPEEKQLEFAARVDYPVRKTAHALEYTVLGTLITGFLYKNGGKKWKYMLFSWMLGVAYAASDEFHQLFVPGRSGQVSDVLLDSGGVLLGVVVMTCILWQLEKHREKRNKPVDKLY